MSKMSKYVKTDVKIMSKYVKDVKHMREPEFLTSFDIFNGHVNSMSKAWRGMTKPHANVLTYRA